MTQSATHVEPLDARQTISSLVDDAVPDVSGLIDLLANRVDSDTCFPIICHGSSSCDEDRLGPPEQPSA